MMEQEQYSPNAAAASNPSPSARAKLRPLPIGASKRAITLRSGVNDLESFETIVRILGFRLENESATIESALGVAIDFFLENYSEYDATSRVHRILLRRDFVMALVVLFEHDVREAVTQATDLEDTVLGDLENGIGRSPAGLTLSSLDPKNWVFSVDEGLLNGLQSMAQHLPLVRLAVAKDFLSGQEDTASKLANVEGPLAIEQVLRRVL